MIPPTCYSLSHLRSPYSPTTPTYIPCNTTALAHGHHSTCCPPHAKCLTNGLCQAADVTEGSNEYWRVGCTDPTGRDVSCPKWCEGVGGEGEGGRQSRLIFGCPAKGGGEMGKWCCSTGDPALFGERRGVNTTCCSDPGLVFRAGKGVVYARVGARVGDAEEVVSSVVVMPMGTTLHASGGMATVSALSTQPPNDFETPTQAINTILPPTPTDLTLNPSLLSTTPLQTSSPQTTHNAKMGGTHKLALGLAAGFGVLITTLLLLIFLLLVYKLRHRHLSPQHDLKSDSCPNPTLPPTPRPCSRVSGHERWYGTTTTLANNKDIRIGDRISLESLGMGMDMGWMRGDARDAVVEVAGVKSPVEVGLGRDLGMVERVGGAGLMS
ncbi:hypothetical protein P154DRAFT_577823 [Amniculicola lignicola CBS 123094]|uniref:Uncharacterized protein n=1 Tax=Amniculicola lignicola CBS 123094 TaxID=1392246 RepID=A0A6A5WBH1_9PLEO|nr:hypothetical protein P154DRAFT_577823 [Amniculicola lignicola CBS 123094]